MEFHGIAPPVVMNIAGLPISNTILAAWLAMLVLIVLVRLATANLSVVPGRLQSVFELVIEQFVSIGTQTADSARARRFLPFAATLFLFIVTANWMGILPFFGEGELFLGQSAEGQGFFRAPTATDHSLFRSANSDLSITLAMALLVFFYSEYAGFRSGGLAYAREFIWPGMFIEIISHLARPVALALRLFGNILAGEILLAVMGSLVAQIVGVPILLPTFFMVFELFVGIVQALIFALLTIAFLAMATAHGAHQAHAEAGTAHH